jgi:predicted metal-dependent HD superfamily phosphohydrolase
VPWPSVVEEPAPERVFLFGELNVSDFAAAWRALGAADDGASVRDALLRAWSASGRHYHARSHLEACLALFDQYRGLAQQPAEVELAIWFHDAIYDARAPDNEEKSAVWAREAMSDADIGAEHVERVVRLVLATKKHHAADSDTALLLDIDLSILGAAPQVFEQFDRDVRQEYAFVPDEGWRVGRGKVLQGFLDRPKIFQTPQLHAAFEQQARANLKQAIEKLQRPQSAQSP